MPDQAGSTEASTQRTPHRGVAHLIVAVVIATAFRLLLAWPGGMWRDEALFIFVVRTDSWADMLRWLVEHESHPPAFYVLARLWAAMFGTGELAMTALTTILGILLVPVAYRAGQLLASQRAAAAAAYLVALSPELARHSVQVRPYSLLPLLCTISVVSLWLMLHRDSWRAPAVWVASTLTLIMTHNWALLAVAGQVLGCAVFLSMTGARQRALLRRLSVAGIALGVLYASWVPFLIRQARQAGHAPVDTTDWRWLLTTFYDSPTDFPFTAAWTTLLLVWLVWQLAHGRRFGGTTLAAALLLSVALGAYVSAVLLSPRSNLLWMRCVVTVIPCVLLAFAIVSTTQRTARWPVLVVGALAFPLTLTALVWAFLPRQRSNAAEVASLINRRARPSDLVVIAPEYLASSVNYYLTVALLHVDYPHVGRQGRVSFANQLQRVTDSSLQQRAIAVIRAARADGRRIWLVRRSGPTTGARPAESGLRAAGDWGAIAELRSLQLRDTLVRLYGEPTLVSDSVLGRGLYESLSAELFASRFGVNRSMSSSIRVSGRRSTHDCGEAWSTDRSSLVRSCFDRVPSGSTNNARVMAASGRSRNHEDADRLLHGLLVATGRCSVDPRSWSPKYCRPELLARRER